MLSAVASFLFGTQVVPPSTSRPEVTEVDLEINEAEDWLLVDVSDQEDGDYDTIDDIAERGEAEEDDDVLSSVPEFLSSVTMIRSTDPANDSQYSPPLSFSNEESWLVTSAGAGELAICEQDFESTDKQQPLRRLFEEGMKHRSSLFNGILQSVRSTDFSAISCLHLSSINKESFWVLGDSLIGGDRNSSRCSTKIAAACASIRPRAVIVTTPYPHKTKHNKQDRRVRHPAEVSGTFINHQPPFAISKVELLEQIKQLKPAQQAKERDSKRHIKKSQMDRQNKTYQFESTNKSKRRRDFYNNNMRRSGANNNRKC